MNSPTSPTELIKPVWNFPRLAASTIGIFVGLLGIAAGLASLLIWYWGPPTDYEFTAVPLAFFLSPFPMILAGASLGMATAHYRQDQFIPWNALSLFSAAIYLGSQFYGNWCVWNTPDIEQNQFASILTLLTTMHYLCCTVVLLLMVTGRQLRQQIATMPNIEQIDDREAKMLLKVCSFFWIMLGAAWTLLLCLFAATL